jgi:two-component system sensor histidine kinase/response regulator
VGVISDIDLLTGEWLFRGEESLITLLSVTAGELMSSPVISVAVDEQLQSVAALMAERGLHRLLVTEAGKPVGVISVSDIVRALGRQVVVERTVAEVMSRAIVVCREDTPLPAVARGMSERYSRSVVVVSSSGAPKGIITGMDLIQLASDDGFENELAGEVVHVPITISSQASLREAADMMITHHVHRLLVVHPDQPDNMPLGILSTSDVMIEMAQPGSTWQAAGGSRG